MVDDGEGDPRIARAVTISDGGGKTAPGGSGRRAPPRRLVIGAAVAVALLALGAWALLRSRRETAELDTSHYLTPMRTAADPATGEVTAPFAGFAVSVETEPPGAIVTVAGVPRGEAPVLAGVDCEPGKRIEIRAEKAGHRAATRSTACRADTLVKLTVRLSR